MALISVTPDIPCPDLLRECGDSDITQLAGQIRAFLIDKVTATGGHLGPNLGVVELTIALHRVFDSPRDTLLFDTGHQAYVHKIVTGRRDGFDRLRRCGGLSGYPSRAESPHDHIENSHASTALAYADGLAKARALNGERDRSVVAVVGDGALTGGLALEALNNIGACPHRPVVVVLNDSGRSYAPYAGAPARHLRGLRRAPRWVLPVSPEVVRLAAAHRLVVTVEDNTRAAGAGTAAAQACSNAGVRTPVVNLGLPPAFVNHGTRAELLKAAGLDAHGIVHSILRARAERPLDITSSPLWNA